MFPHRFSPKPLVPESSSHQSQSSTPRRRFFSVMYYKQCCFITCYLPSAFPLRHSLQGQVPRVRHREIIISPVWFRSRICCCCFLSRRQVDSTSNRTSSARPSHRAEWSTEIEPASTARAPTTTTTTGDHGKKFSYAAVASVRSRSVVFWFAQSGLLFLQNMEWKKLVQLNPPSVVGWQKWTGECSVVAGTLREKSQTTIDDDDEAVRLGMLFCWSWCNKEKGSCQLLWSRFGSLCCMGLPLNVMPERNGLVGSLEKSIALPSSLTPCSVDMWG